MDEKNISQTPFLTLDPDLGQSAEAAPQTPETSGRAAAKTTDDLLSSMSDEEQQMVSDFSEKIDISNSNMVLRYGADAQKKLANFSESALGNVRTKDLGEVGDMITDLIGELKDFEEDEDEGGIFGFFKRQGDKLSRLKTKYDKAEANVEKIASMLEDHQIQLFKDIALLDQMYEKNLLNFKELTMYIAAGKLRLEKAREVELKELADKARASGKPEDAQAANDLASLCDRFEKKLHDLELTRVISMQMAPQIRMVQNNDTLMAEKIQTTLTSTLPLWKSQMVLALGLEHSNRAMQAQREVSEMTNQLLKKNAETLKQGTIGIARESERGLVDIETLKQTNETLISTLDEVINIQNEGRQKRREAEQELGKIEDSLKQKLLEINSDR